ncbi:MAG: hypothetical protein M1822_002364 [Bathelium mastoideum]|nr:MAG: hypothetical protein M1822_002364 [Bathelium mastoideum]
MTDKCWFVLRHTHHPPPIIPEDGVGKPKGPLCIGHVIPSPKWLDIINPEGPSEYRPSMPLYAGAAYDLKWTMTEGEGIDVSAKVDAPIAAVAGVDIGLKAGIAFKESANRFWEFERLETSYVNITQSYVDDTMDAKEVQRYVSRHKKWLVLNHSLFIITGIMVARKAKVKGSDNAQGGVSAEEKMEVPELVGASGKFDVSGEKKISFSQQVNDFVFAVQVAKVTKGILNKDWSWATLSEGATFAAGDNIEERIKSIKTQLGKNGLGHTQTIGLEDGAKEVFVL